jgi:hypothetical protein
MKRDENIDDWIAKAIEENSPERNYYIEIYRTICTLYKKISIDAFNLHLKQMVGSGLISKNGSPERGKRVFYFLTGKAIRKQRLKIFHPSHPEIGTESDKRLKLYFLMLWFHQSMKAGYVVEGNEGDEEVVNTILSMVNAPKEDLIIDRKRKIHIGNKHFLITTFKPLSNIDITKKEIIGGPQKGRRRVEYGFFPRGVSPEDLLKPQPLFEDLHITSSDIDEAINLLKDEGLISPITVNSKITFVITEELLEELISDCWFLYCKVYGQIERALGIRGPTKEEKIWLERFFGHKRVNEIIRYTYNYRRSLSQEVKKHNARQEEKDNKVFNQWFSEYVGWIYKKYSDVIEKYRVPIEDLLAFIYPTSTHNLSVLGDEKT